MTDDSTARQSLEPGTHLLHYELRGVLGAGGFGVTYRGFDTQLHRAVAIKEFLPSEFAVRDVATATVKARESRAEDYRYGLNRFLDEARTLARFDHPNIIRILGFFETNGTAYVVMPFEEGQSLSQYLRSCGGTLPEPRLRELAIPVLRGLMAVHAQGFLHRDIKPGNIYLRAEGKPVLLDFGAARQALGEHSRSVTGIVSAGYAPPEQYTTDAKKQGPWTDLYAFGATLYRCISGKDPVDSPTRREALHDGDPDPLAPATEVGEGRYSNALLRLIDQLLVLTAKQRPQSAVEVLAALEQNTPLPESTQQPAWVRPADQLRSTIVTEKVQDPQFAKSYVSHASLTGVSADPSGRAVAAGVNASDPGHAPGSDVPPAQMPLPPQSRGSTRAPGSRPKATSALQSDIGRPLALAMMTWLLCTILAGNVVVGAFLALPCAFVVGAIDRRVRADSRAPDVVGAANAEAEAAPKTERLRAEAKKLALAVLLIAGLFMLVRAVE